MLGGWVGGVYRHCSEYAFCTVLTSGTMLLFFTLKTNTLKKIERRMDSYLKSQKQMNQNIFKMNYNLTGNRKQKITFES